MTREKLLPGLSPDTAVGKTQNEHFILAKSVFFSLFILLDPAAASDATGHVVLNGQRIWAPSQVLEACLDFCSPSQYFTVLLHQCQVAASLSRIPNSGQKRFFSEDFPSLKQQQQQQQNKLSSLLPFFSTIGSTLAAQLIIPLFIWSYFSPFTTHIHLGFIQYYSAWHQSKTVNNSCNSTISRADLKRGASRSKNPLTSHPVTYQKQCQELVRMSDTAVPLTEQLLWVSGPAFYKQGNVSAVLWPSVIRGRWRFMPFLLLN